MHAGTEGICLINDFDGETYIPVEIYPGDGNIRRGTDTSIVELGKQLLLHAKDGDTEAVRDLMCRGAPFTTDWLGTSALHFAALHNHTETAEVLLRAGISRDARTKVERTPLHMAAYEGHFEMVQLLLNYGADVNSRDMLKMTPLHWAVEREHPEIMQLLLENGADSNAVSKFNKTPVSIALEHDRMDYVELLQQEREIVDAYDNHISTQEIQNATQNLLQLQQAENEKEQNSNLLSDSEKKTIIGQSSAKKPKMLVQKIYMPSENQDNQEKGNSEILKDKNIRVENRNHNIFTNFSDLGNSLKLLQAHGIAMIPMDESTIVGNAMESGQTVVLTDAGKLVLNDFNSKSPKMNVKQLQMGPKKNSKKIVTVKTEPNIPTFTSRAPNILKRPATSDTKNMGKYILTSISQSPQIIPNSTQNNNCNTTIATIRKNNIVQTKKLTSQPMLFQISNNEEKEINQRDLNIAILSRKLAEVKREAEEYRSKLKKKEEEAELYRQQLKTITAQKMSK